MTDATVTAGKTPWWFWLVSIVAVLWNGFGAYDFTMSAVQGDAYYQAMKLSAAEIAYMHTYPAWMWVVWFAGTWGGFIGAILLLLRRRWALPVFVVSLAGFLLSLVYEYFLSSGNPVAGNMAPMQGVIFVGCVFFIWFAWWTGKKGILR